MLSAKALRRASWALMVVVAATTLVYGAIDEGSARSNEERAADLASTIACPRCDGQSSADSNAPVAVSIRAEIKRMVDEGRTDEEIRARMIATYGEFVDLNPSRDGLTGVVWVAPFLVIGVGCGALALAFARWRVRGAAELPSAEDEALVARALADLDDAAEEAPDD